ncbi:hypothetical protein [Aeromonas hydrophila]|uniref:hypothetical protein n=1 Tax=Aeromonas hydrophila TaxID=644 RepID=UPI0038D11EFA
MLSWFGCAMDGQDSENTSFAAATAGALTCASRVSLVAAQYNPMGSGKLPAKWLFENIQVNMVCVPLLAVLLIQFAASVLTSRLLSVLASSLQMARKGAVSPNDSS